MNSPVAGRLSFRALASCLALLTALACLPAIAVADTARVPTIELDYAVSDDPRGALKRAETWMQQGKARGDKVYAITNFSREKWAECLVRFPFLQSFDGVVVSAHERMLKPERAIYEVLFDRYGLKAGDCIFVDDSEKNVVGARAAGMRAVHFVEPIDLRAELRGLGVRL